MAQDTKAKSQTWDLWTYMKDGGWWVEEWDYDDVTDACAHLAELIGSGQFEGGCVLPHGETPCSGLAKLQHPGRQFSTRFPS